MPILEAVAVVELLVEPLQPLDLLGLRLEHLALVINLSQLLVFHHLNLLFGQVCHLFHLLRVIANQFFEIRLHLLHEVDLLLILIAVAVMGCWLLDDLFPKLLPDFIDLFCLVRINTN